MPVNIAARHVPEPDVAAVAALIGDPGRSALAQNTSARNMRVARSCYDHAAGLLGVGVTEWLLRTHAIAPSGEREYVLGAHAARRFAEFDIDVLAIERRRRSFARACLDWTERRPHLAGALGAALLESFLRNDLVLRNVGSRALRITPAGRAAFAERCALRFG